MPDAPQTASPWMKQIWVTVILAPLVPVESRNTHGTGRLHLEGMGLSSLPWGLPSTLELGHPPSCSCLTPHLAPHLAFCTNSFPGEGVMPQYRPPSCNGHDILSRAPSWPPSRPPSWPPSWPPSQPPSQPLSQPLGHYCHSTPYHGHGAHCVEQLSVANTNLLLTSGRITLAQHERVISCIGECLHSLSNARC